MSYNYFLLLIYLFKSLFTVYFVGANKFFKKKKKRKRKLNYSSNRLNIVVKIIYL